MRNIFYKVKKIFSEKGITEVAKGNKLIMILTLVLLISMIFGSVCVDYINLNTIKKLDILFLSDFDSRSNQKGLYTFISSFSSLFLFWIALIMSTLSFWGIIVVPLILIFRSWGLGLTSGYLYLIYGLKGVAFYILVLLPGIFISSVAFILMSANSMKFSLRVSKKFLPNSNEKPLWDAMVLYIKRSTYILGILMISSLIDMLFMKIFSNLFVF